MEGIKSHFTAHEGEVKVLSSEELVEIAEGFETNKNEPASAPEIVAQADPAAIEAADTLAAQNVRERLASHGEAEKPMAIKPEAATPSLRQAPVRTEGRAIEKKQTREMGPAELLGDIDLPSNLGKDKFDRPRSEFLNRLRSGEKPSEVLQDALRQEERSNGETRTKFGMRSLMTGLGAGVLSLGAGVTASYAGVGAVTLGAIAMPAIGAGAIGLGVLGGAGIAIGGLGWLGMKAYHSVKEGRHKKAFSKLTGRTAY